MNNLCFCDSNVTNLGIFILKAYLIHYFCLSKSEESSPGHTKQNSPIWNLQLAYMTECDACVTSADMCAA